MSSWLRILRRELKASGDPVKAPQMQAYMKSAMPYHGVQTVPMRALCKEVFRDIQFRDADEWRDAVLCIWRGARFREERYAALALTGVRQAREFQTPEAMPLYEELIVDGAWWDYVDLVATNRVGPIVRGFPAPMKKMMRQWSRSDDIWKRRTSIICQIGSKKDTDLKLLYDCIEPSLKEKEFFLRKATGWALRQYAWTDPDEVLRYVREMGDRLSPLSRREALKNLVR